MSSPLIAIVTIDRSARHRRGILAAGTAMLGLSSGLALGQRHGHAVLGALRELWVETLLPAFLAVHASGLPSCS